MAKKKYIRTVERQKPDPNRPGRYKTLHAGEVVEADRHPGPGFVEYTRQKEEELKGTAPSEPSEEKTVKEGKDNGKK